LIIEVITTRKFKTSLFIILVLASSMIPYPGTAVALELQRSAPAAPDTENIIKMTANTMTKKYSIVDPEMLLPGNTGIDPKMLIMDYPVVDPGMLIQVDPEDAAKKNIPVNIEKVREKINMLDK